MKKTKRIALAGIVLTAGLISPALMADTVILIQNPYSYDVGGEFSAITSSSYDYNANYAADTLESTAAGIGFSTFCVQTQVDFSPYNAPWDNHTPYNFTTSSGSIGTGWNPSDTFPLSAGVAYLYSQFAQGDLSGYDYNTLNDPLDAAARLADAGELQSAIWYLQGNQSYGGYVSGNVGNTFYNDAVGVLGADVDESAASYGNNYGVEIMNLTDGSGNAAQNQLVYVGGGGGGHQNVPDTGATLALLGLSLAGLAACSRKLAAVRAL